MSGIRGGESAGSTGPSGRSGVTGVASPSANPVGRDKDRYRSGRLGSHLIAHSRVPCAGRWPARWRPNAFAQTSTTPQSGTMAPGGSTYTSSPVIKKVRCVTACASRKRLRGGSTARIEGRYLGGVTKVTFHGSVGRRDDRRVAVKPGTSTRRLRVPVPLSAVSGPVSVQRVQDRQVAPLALGEDPPGARDRAQPGPLRRARARARAAPRSWRPPPAAPSSTSPAAASASPGGSPTRAR